MTSEESDIPVLFLKPGELVICCEPVIVQTLLGSCVAVTMYSARHRMGAICHALLPSCRHEHACNVSYPEGGRYVECSIKLMLEGLRQRGVGRRDIEIKLFGGANMFETSDGGRRSVGAQNVEKALQVLKFESLHVAGSDLGGERGRKIFFHTHTGEVFLKHLRRSEL